MGMGKFMQVRIGDAVVDFGASSITNAKGESVAVEPKVINVLQFLASQQGQVLSRNYLINSVWGSSSGADEGLTRAISHLRKAFGDSPGHRRYIKTVPKRGYSLEESLFNLDGSLLTEADCSLLWSADDSSVADGSIGVFSPPPLSLAVLSLADLSSDKSYDYLCDGMSEEIINRLTHYDNLKVSGRTSAFTFKGEKQDIRAIARALNVAYVIEGSVRRDGNELCITVQLINGNTGFHISSNTYKGAASELFAFQEKVANLVTNEVVKKLGVSALGVSTPPSHVSTEAYQLFLRGKQFTHMLNGQMVIPMGIDYLQQAIDLEPEFDEAWAWLALSHFILLEYSATNDWAAHIEKSRQAFEQALKLNSKSSIGWLVKAMHLMRDFEFDRSLECYECALKLDPKNIETLAGMGLGLMAIGAHAKARHYFELVIESDPLCGIWYCNLGVILLQAGEFDAAEASFFKSYKLGFGAAVFGVAYAMVVCGKSEQAAKFVEDNFHALGPIEKPSLQSWALRKLIINALIKRKPFATMIVSFMFSRRLNDESAQPNTVSLMNFFWMDHPKLFIRSMLNKPNPYLGYTIANAWEATATGKNVRLHPDFMTLINRTKLVASWKKYGWPEQVAPDNHSNSKHGFTITG